MKEQDVQQRVYLLSRIMVHTDKRDAFERLRVAGIGARYGEHVPEYRGVHLQEALVHAVQKRFVVTSIAGTVTLPERVRVRVQVGCWSGELDGEDDRAVSVPVFRMFFVVHHHHHSFSVDGLTMANAMCNY